MKVTLHWAERFINWYAFNTKLYLRGERGADHKKANALREELFTQLVPFLDKLKQEAEHAALEKAAEVCEQVSVSIETGKLSAAYVWPGPEKAAKECAAAIRKLIEEME